LESSGDALPPCGVPSSTCIRFPSYSTPRLAMRVPKPLLTALKARAKARGIPYTQFIRETLERAIAVPKR
jgi:predicted DNA binding CopG/RHH family protein